MLRAHRAIALDQGQNRGFTRAALTAGCAFRLVLVRFLATHVGLVNLDNLIIAAELRSVGAIVESMADTMRHEPSSLVGYAEHTVQLVRRHALFARDHKLKRQNPLVQRDVRSLEDRSYRDGELLSTAFALPQARALFLAAQSIRRADQAAMRADRTIGPKLRFKPFAGGFGIVKNRIVGDRHLGLLG